uniref:Butyrophilin subfamily 1 member A1 n=1 Tax=Ursus americanus TaxID=9643 RepID=A0A452QDK1_URSAM
GVEPSSLCFTGLPGVCDACGRLEPLKEFMVIGPSDPIVAVLRGDVTLPCSVSPAMNVENMELRWFRSKFSEAVFIYQNQQEQREEQLAQYTGRTSLVKEFLTWGEAAVRIHNVQAFDNGMYTCFFRKGSFYESASLELKVAVVHGQALLALCLWVVFLLSVTLDPKSAHPSLAVSDEKTSVTLKDTAEDPTILFSILGRESITSGRCYWVVEIRNGDKSEWSLGVCRGDVDRKSLHLESPEKGIWAVGRYLENYYACSIFRILLSCRQVPHRVGVFLDLKEGDVSFYNMTDDSHMFSFPLASSSGTLFPYFMLRSGDVSLTICSVMGGPAEILVPLNNPPSSSEEPVSLSGVGLKSVSDVDGALPGAESPLLPCSPEAMSP